MTLQVLIVDDEPAAGIYLKSIIEQVPGTDVIAAVSSAREALEKTSVYSPHVVFLDVDMPEMNGIELAQALVEMQNDMLLVFATAYPDYALKAFELYAFDYILKPFNEKRIKKTVKKLIRRIQTQVQETDRSGYSSSIPIDTPAGKIFLNPAEIFYIESNKSKITIKTKSDDYITKGNLRFLEKALAPYGFFRTHRSYLVNLRYIREITPLNYTYEIVMLSEDKVLLSRHQEKHLRDKLKQIR